MVPSQLSQQIRIQGLENPQKHHMAYSREGQITECLAMLHMGRFIIDLKMYKIFSGLEAAKITDYIKKRFK